MLNLLSDPVTLSVFLLVITAVVYLYKRRYSYWESRGIFQLPRKFFYGNEDPKRAFGLQFIDHYRKFKAAGVKFGGIYLLFSVPIFVPVDLELIKNILVKDFDLFVDRQSDIPMDNEPLANHLFNMTGDRWKALRAKLTPTFTSGKIKMMYPTLLACTDGLSELLSKVSTSSAPVDIKDILSRFTADVIGSCAFGLECNSMKDPNSEFIKYGKEVFKMNLLKRLLFMTAVVLPARIIKLVNFKQFGSELENFYLNTVKNIVDYREKDKVSRNDFMHLLLQLKNKGTLDDEAGKTTDEKLPRNAEKSLLTFEEIAAQCFLFFIAGYETSSTVMTFTLLEMAVNQHVQSKLREEIQSVLKKHDNQLTYECVMEMKYLDCAIQESMRKYSPIQFLQRECTRKYKIPDTDVVLEQKTKIVIPITGIHMDEEFYPEPEKFDPDRFNEENRAKIPHFAHLPFGEGPRNCIGLRFGLLQTKLGLATTLRDYKVTLNEKMKMPFEYDAGSFITSVKGDVWLNVEKLQKDQNLK